MEKQCASILSVPVKTARLFHWILTLIALLTSAMICMDGAFAQNCRPTNSQAIADTVSRALRAFHESNYTIALELFRKAAAQCDRRAEFMLGVFADRGFGRSQDYHEAMVWYQRAAAQGAMEAQSNIGLLYKNGLGVPQDYEEAMRWYRLAATQGDALSQYQVGYLYAEGLGTVRDMGSAREWIRKAAAAGLPDAKEWLARDAAKSGDSAESGTIDLRRIVFLMSPTWIFFRAKPTTDGDLIMRRYSIITDKTSFDNVDLKAEGDGTTSLPMVRDQLINSAVFVCKPNTAHSDHLIFHLPNGVHLGSFPLNEWVSHLEARTLADGNSRQFASEYIKGDLFIDWEYPNNSENFLRLLNAKRLSIEFGSGNDRLNFAIETNVGPTNVDGAIRALLPMYLNSGMDELTHLSTAEMLNVCWEFKRTGKIKTKVAGEHWIIWGTTSCPTCDQSKGLTSATIEFGTKDDKSLPSESECDAAKERLSASAKKQNLATQLYCIKAGDD
jgi:hypothetical protein